MSGTLAELNPLRYRGYVYDQETGFYYLNSRYYDPAVGRFISADRQLALKNVIGTNLFAYCFNNPVSLGDGKGNWPKWVEKVAFVASVVVTYGYASGQISSKAQEATEEIEVVLADKEEVKRILQEENVAIMTAYMLMHFLEDKEPFAFLNQIK